MLTNFQKRRNQQKNVNFCQHSAPKSRAFINILIVLVVTFGCFQSILKRYVYIGEWLIG